MNNISEHANDSISRMIVGNKCDMISDRCVSTEKGMALANEYGVSFYETSDKNDINVQKVFVDIAKEIIANKFPDENESIKIDPVPTPHIKRNCACQLL